MNVHFFTFSLTVGIFFPHVENAGTTTEVYKFYMKWTHKHRYETSNGCDLLYSTGDRSTLAGPLITVPL